MSTYDYGKALGDFWAAQGKALLDAQGKAGQMMTEGLQALASGTVPMMPGIGQDAPMSAELLRAQQSMGELWAAANAMSGLLAQAVPAQGDPTVAATVNKLVDPRSWMGGVDELGNVLGRMAEGPRLADLWGLERLYARVMQAWVEVRRAGLEHNAVVLEAWVQAGQRFTEEMAGRSSTAQPKLDAKAAMVLWTDIANRQLLENQRSEPFLRTQTATIRASTALRMAQQELVEHLGKQYGFPTRTELDDVHRTVTELRREIRALRREMRTQQAATAAVPVPAPEPIPVPVPAAAPPPARRTKRGARA